MSRNKPDYGNESISALKGAERVRLRPGVILVRMDWKAVSMQSLKFYQTQLMKLEKDMAMKLPPLDMKMVLLRLLIMVEAFLLNGTRKSNVIIGNLYSASCMLAVNIKIILQKTMSSRLV